MDGSSSCIQLAVLVHYHYFPKSIALAVNKPLQIHCESDILQVLSSKSKSPPACKTYKPVTPSRAIKPALIGRNTYSHISCTKKLQSDILRNGGHKQRICEKRGTWCDPGRSAHLALNKRCGLPSSQRIELSFFSLFPRKNPRMNGPSSRAPGTVVHNLALTPTGLARLVRSAGTSALVISHETAAQSPSPTLYTQVHRTLHPIRSSNFIDSF
ncbi:hypothetical protein BT96DRAFT_81144 [Gymnopus androsaceus JB14]|uniref:Uncharacterized protein n=1 Tax=Gymnopus androsaceus JB14 TaxID=1447944 RepID=A0A6A4I6Q0_9AGAR|nr:hypothetical protein BT96DRAFT_81144 [Gymnopus androsaceus JB14]